MTRPVLEFIFRYIYDNGNYRYILSVGLCYCRLNSVSNTSVSKSSFPLSVFVSVTMGLICQWISRAVYV